MSKRKCAHCKSYFDKEDMIVDGLSAYCCQEHRNSKPIPANKPLKQRSSRARTTTTSRQKQRDKLPEQIREQVVASDNNRCRFCGGTDNLAVHHIYYKSQARNEPWLNQPHNLITLCNYPCHIQYVHGNKNKYQPLCLGIVWLREIEGDKFTLIPELE